MSSLAPSLGNAFADELVAAGVVSAVEAAVLRAADIRSAEDLHATLTVFPSLAAAGVRIPYLSSQAAVRSSSAYLNSAATFNWQTSPQVEFGALAPGATPYGTGAMLPMPNVGAGTPVSSSPIAGQLIDYRPPLWPVRDQVIAARALRMHLRRVGSISAASRTFRSSFFIGRSRIVTIRIAIRMGHGCPMRLLPSVATEFATRSRGHTIRQR